MQKKFHTSAGLSEAEIALKNWGIKYKKQPDGSILVPGDLIISKRGLTSLPDLSKVTVVGSFSCAINQLTSLKGAPRIVRGNYYCHSNQLTSLNWAPSTITGDFYCTNNKLISLESGPQFVGGNFMCSITS